MSIADWSFINKPLNHREIVRNGVIVPLSQRLSMYECGMSECGKKSKLRYQNEKSEKMYLKSAEKYCEKMSNLRKANEKCKKGFTATKVCSKKFNNTDLDNPYNQSEITASYYDNIITLVELYTDETTEDELCENFGMLFNTESFLDELYLRSAVDIKEKNHIMNQMERINEKISALVLLYLKFTDKTCFDFNKKLLLEKRKKKGKN